MLESTDPEPGLPARIAQELARPASEAAGALVEAIRARHGACVAAVLFYGSCLRRETDEGVHDFYVVVDSYRSAHARRWHAWSNALLPPNVYYLELPRPSGTVRTKYAVISMGDFERCVRPHCIHPYIWARFAQPVLLAYVRDPEARQRLVAALTEAVVTLVRQLSPFLPHMGRVQRFSLAALWQEAFRRTYSAELRNESPETIRSLYESAAVRYDGTGTEALRLLEARGWLDRVSVRGYAVEIEMDPHRRTRTRLRWQLLRPLAKLLTVLRLLKTTMTFGDWLPYVLWKLERHGGARIEPTDLQRRFPLIFGWPVFFRLIAKRSIR